MCRILSLTPSAIHDCLCNGHKLLRQTLEIDFCLRKDHLSKKGENRWNGETTPTTQRKKDEGVKVREEGKSYSSKDASVSSHLTALRETTEPFSHNENWMAVFGAFDSSLRWVNLETRNVGALSKQASWRAPCPFPVTSCWRHTHTHLQSVHTGTYSDNKYPLVPVFSLQLWRKWLAQLR